MKEIKVKNITDIGKMIQEELNTEENKDLKISHLSKFDKKLESHSVKKIINGEGNVIFLTVLKAINFFGYEIILRKKKKEKP